MMSPDRKRALRVQRARQALTWRPSTGDPFAALTRTPWWDREALRDLLVQAGCPPVCIGRRRRVGEAGPDLHEGCERRAEAALAILEGGPDGLV